MKKIILSILSVFLVFLFSLNVFSQTLSFTEHDLGQLTTPSNNEVNTQWIDYDCDGDLDIYYTCTRYHGFFRNDSNTFVKEQFPSSIISHRFSWGDIDLDGDPDLIVYDTLFTNDGTGSFTVSVIPYLENKEVDGLDLADMDNDGDLDLICIIADKFSTGYFGTILFNENGTFHKSLHEFYVNYSYTTYDVKCMDLNQDNLSDIIFCDRDSIWTYINYGSYFKMEDAKSAPVYMLTEISFIDFDGDFDLDIIASGTVVENNYPDFSKLTSLSGDANLIEAGDVDNDGDLDMMYVINSKASELFINNAGEYTNSGLSFPAFKQANGNWGDYDNDGDLDFVIAYMIGSSYHYMRIFENNINTENSPPEPPSTLNEIVSGNSATLSWNAGSDDETAVNNLMYNIYIEKAGNIIKSPGADTSGFLRWNTNGNIGQNYEYKINSLDTGSYFWGVQSIDVGAKGSEFATTGSFTITHSNNIAPSNEQRLHPSTDGDELTVSEVGAFNSRYWAYSETHGGPYTTLGATSTTYTPNFNDPGEYYVACISIVGTDTVISNEVIISTLFFEEIELPMVINSNITNIEMVDFDNDDDYDILVTNETDANVTRIYESDLDTFIAVGGFTPLALTFTSSVSFDYNNDGLVDILLSGVESGGDYTTILYNNKGNFNFDSVAAFPGAGIIDGNIDAGDYNNDGLKDFVICGVGPTSEALIKVYKNTGRGVFTEQEIVLAPVANGCAKWIDLNNDGYLDLFLTGKDISGNPSTYYYVNDKQGDFAQATYNFQKLKDCDVAFGDYNNDNLIDILLVGKNSSYQFNTYVYKNIDGLQFDEIIVCKNNSTYNSCSWLDYDNDNDLDILLVSDNTIRTNPSDVYPVNIIIENKGSNQFEKNIGFSRQMNYRGVAAVQVVKYDSDTDADFLQLAIDTSDIKYLVAYNNLVPTVKSTPTAPDQLSAYQEAGVVSFSWSDNNPLPNSSMTYNCYVYSGDDFTVAPDANVSNGFKKIAKSGLINDTSWTLNNLAAGKYYWKVQAIDNSFNTSVFSSESSFIMEDIFEPDTSASFLDIEAGATAWGDYDDDGDLDLLIAGSANGTYVTKVYKNTNGSFSEVNTSLTGLFAYNETFAEWLDIDNDNKLDIILFGAASKIYKDTKFLIYRNMGGDVFDLVYTRNGMSTGDYGDLDNDGDIDFALSSYYYIYNDGGCVFTEVYDNRLFGTTYTNIVDVDNDLDKDVICIGSYTSSIFKNNGNRNFSSVSNSIPPYMSSSGDCVWFDYNHDTYVDAVITGRLNNFYTTKVYINNQDVTFSEMNLALKGSDKGDISFGDYENDGDYDFFIIGENELPFVELYENKNATNFTAIDYDFARSGPFGKSRMGDYDNDGDLDIIATGEKGDTSITTLYKNTRNWTNTAPTAPEDLVAERIELDVIFSWSESVDNESTNGGLSYNIRIGTTPGGFDIVSPMSDIASGYRKVAIIGNAQYNTSFKIADMPLGTYFWSVQAIDHSFAGGAWSAEQSITISNVNVNYSFTEVCLGLTTEFTDESVANGVTISHWDWNFGDGNTSTDQNPIHQFGAPGTYQVKLVTSYMDEGIKTPADSITKDVNVLPVIEADFAANLACHGFPTNFTNNSVMNGLTASNWLWDFGDGKTSDSSDPETNGYLNPGDYTAKLKVTANNGCLDSISKLVQVAEIPEVGVTADGSLTFCSGDSVNLSVPYDAGYIYSWKRNSTLVTNGDSCIYSPKLSGSYTVDVQNTFGNCIDTSDSKIITVNTIPSSPIISASGTTTFCNGDSVILSVTDNSDYSYSWKLNDGAIGSDSSTFTAKLAGTYSLVITNSTLCSSEAINEIEVIVNDIPSVPTVSISGKTTFCDGNSVTLSVENDPLINYQWKNLSGNISGETSNSIIINTQETYWLNVSDAIGCASNTQEVDVTVNTVPSQPTISTSGTSVFCQGDSVILFVTNNPALDYKWKMNGGLVGLDTNNYVAKAAGSYSLEVRNSTGCLAQSSNTLSVTVNDIPTIPSINLSGPTTFCDGENVEISVTNNPDYTYQWKNEYGNIGEATTNQLRVEETGTYYLQALNSSNCSAQTESTVVTVLETPANPTISNYGSTTFCNGDSIQLSVTNNSSLNYQWLQNGGDVGINSNEYYAKTSGNYTLEINSNNGCSVQATNTIDITVNNTPTIPSINFSGSTTFCDGENVEISVINNPDYTYQWKNEYENIVGATTNQLKVEEAGTYYLQALNSSNCSAQTESVVVTVLETPANPTISNYGSTTFCNGDSVQLSVTNNSSLNYQWLQNGGDVGINSNKYYAKTSGNYTLEVNNNNGCSVQATNTIDITVNNIPTIPSINLSGSTTFCDGENVEISVINNPDYTYQWKNEYENIAGATTNQLRVEETGTYYLQAINSSNCSSRTESVLVTVMETPARPLILNTGSTTFCKGDSVQLFVSDNPNLSYLWLKNGGVLNEVETSMYAKLDGNYSLMLTNSNKCTALSSNSVQVITNDNPEKPVISLSGATNFCEGKSLILSTNKQDDYTYQWSNENGEILNANLNNYIVSNTGNYYVEVINALNCKNTSITTAVSVSEMPIKPIITTMGYDINDCPQEKIITLSVDQATNQYTYQWLRNGVVIDDKTEPILEDYLEEGDYSVIANNNGCEDESDIEEIYYSPELPEKPGITAKGPNVWYLACTNNEAQQYQWYYNNEIIPDATEYVYVANQNLGTYYIKMTEENGCFVISDAITIPLTVTDIDNPDPFAKIKIYPNPTPGVFTIAMNNELFGELITRIFSRNAVEILNIKFNKSTQHFKAQVDLSGQGSGLYIISFTLDKYKAERKIIVE